MTINSTSLHPPTFANMSNNDMAATRWLSEAKSAFQDPSFPTRLSTLQTAINTGNFSSHVTALALMENPLPALPQTRSQIPQLL